MNWCRCSECQDGCLHANAPPRDILHLVFELPTHRAEAPFRRGREHPVTEIALRTTPIVGRADRLRAGLSPSGLEPPHDRARYGSAGCLRVRPKGPGATDGDVRALVADRAGPPTLVG